MNCEFKIKKQGFTWWFHLQETHEVDKHINSPLGGGGTWGNFCWVYVTGLSEPLPHYSLFCGHIIDPILVTLGKKWFSQSQLCHSLIMHLPDKFVKLANLSIFKCLHTRFFLLPKSWIALEPTDYYFKKLLQWKLIYHALLSVWCRKKNRHHVLAESSRLRLQVYRATFQHLLGPAEPLSIPSS